MRLLLDTFITPSWVTRDVAMFWKNSIKLVGKFDRQWNAEWSKSATKLGDTIQVRIPQRFVVNEGQALIIQSILNQTVPLSINHQYQVGMEWSSADSALRVEEVQKRYTKHAGVEPDVDRWRRAPARGWCAGGTLRRHRHADAVGDHQRERRALRPAAGH
jgi:hypothetical protein